MSLFLSMLPFYLFGNLHCIGMCGPLVMMLGQHPYRYFYFLGRTLAFSLAGMLAGALGAVLNLSLRELHIPAISSFLFGATITLIGIYALFGWHYPGYQWAAGRLGRLHHSLTVLMLRNRPFPAFLFGFFTISLPCGQTLIVFSACAMTGDSLVGLWNGFAFALLTSPALLLALHAHLVLRPLRTYYNQLMGSFALLIGILSLCRGFAEIEWIDHWVVNPESLPHYHVVIY